MGAETVPAPAGGAAGAPPVVLHVIDNLSAGGAQWYLGGVVHALATDRRTRNVVVHGAGDEDPGLLALVESVADDVVAVHSPRLLDGRIPWAVARHAHRRDAALVHSHLTTATLAGRPAALAVGRPHVTTVHQLPGPKAEDLPRRRAAERWTTSLSRLLLAPSRAVAEAVAAAWRPARGRLRVVPSPLPPRPSAPAAPLRRELEVADDALLVVCLARLVPEKGLDVLADALADAPGVVCAVAGDGPEREATARRAAASGGALRLLGRRSDVPALLAAADAVVLPSRREALPMSLLEAMDARRPVLATAVGGIPGLLEGAGLLCPPDDPAALAAGLRELGDRELRRSLADAGRRRVRTRHGPAAVAAAHARAYAEVLGSAL